VLRNDLIGTTTLQFEELLNNKNKWSVNRSLKLKDPNKKTKEESKQGKDTGDNAGSIYIQCKFVEEGAVDAEPMAQIIEKEMQVEGKEGVDFAPTNYKGILLIHAVCGRDLRAADGDTSDPLCQIVFGKNAPKTDKIKKTLDPNWKKIFKFKVDIKTSVRSSIERL
jgi:hypothetical protein